MTNIPNNSDYVTVLTVKGRGNKLVTRAKDGSTDKDAGPPIADAVAQTVHIETSADMVRLQREIGNNSSKVLSLGFVPGTEDGKPFRFLSKKVVGKNLGVDPDTQEGLEAILGWHEVNGERCICRLKANMVPSSWCLFDIDAVRGMPEHLANMDSDGRLDALAEIIPGFADVGLVVIPSTTGRVLVDGKPMDATGEHLYMQLEDASDLERFGAVLLQRSLLSGFGFMRPKYSKSEPDKIVCHIPWGIADPTTFSHERLVYDGAPEVIGKGLKVALSVINVIEGKRLDTSVLLALADDEIETYASKTGQRLVKSRRTETVLDTSGKVIAREVLRFGTVDERLLKFDTPIETQAGVITLGDYWKGEQGKLRCQTPFRESSSWNGILNRHADGSPFVYDNGLRTRYVLSAALVEKHRPDIYAARLAALHELIEATAKMEEPASGPLISAFAKLDFDSAVDKGRYEKAAAKALGSKVRDFLSDVAKELKRLESKRKKAIRPPEGSSLIHLSKPLPTARTFIAECFTSDKQATLLRSNGDFCAFDGLCYRMNSDNAIHAAMYGFLEACVTESDTGFEAVHPKAKMVSEITDALKAEAHLNDSLSAPCWIDSDNNHPPADELLICKNGLLHMPSREVHPLSPAFFSLNALTYDYDADAPEPTAFYSFLDDLFEDDQEAEDLLQEIFGYIVSGATSLQKIPMIIGPKRSGKGTLGRVLVELIGPANTCSPRLESLGRQFGLQPMIGKKLAYMSDVRLEGMAKQQTIAENLLRVSGEDDVNAERKGKEDWYGRLPVRFLMLSNMVPRIADPSGALSGRFTMLVLKNSFFGREDPNLTERLLTELPGILLWALKGWDRLQKNGRFTVPTSSAEAVASLERLTSPISAFLDDKCQTGEGHDVSVGDLFYSWKSWCTHENRNFPGTKETFCRDLHAAVPGVKKVRKRIGIERPYFYRGVGLQSATSSAKTGGQLDV